MIDNAVEYFKRSFDSIHGDFGRALKFPTPHNMLFLMMYAKYNPNSDAKLIYENPPEYVTIVLDDKSVLSEIRMKLPFIVNISVVCESEKYSLLNNKTTYYVCKNHLCLPPTNEYTAV